MNNEEASYTNIPQSYVPQDSYEAFLGQYEWLDPAPWITNRSHLSYSLDEYDRNSSRQSMMCVCHHRRHQTRSLEYGDWPGYRSPAMSQIQETSLMTPFSYKKFITIVLFYGLLTMIVFFVGTSYIFAATFHANSKNHNFQVLFVDYDNGGAISQSVQAAYQALKGSQFLEMVNGSAVVYPDVASLMQSVQKQEFWAAIYVSEGTSDSFQNAVMDPHITFNSTEAMGYVWNEIRYPSMSASVVRPNIVSLFAVAQTIFESSNFSRELLSSAIAQNLTQTALRTYLLPFQPMEINPWAAPQLSKSFYNTVLIALCLAEMNTLVVAVTQLAKRFGIFSQISYFASASVLISTSLIFSLLAALLTTGLIWSFRESWQVDGSRFFQTWMVLWLFMHIAYHLLDAVLSFTGLAYYPAVFVIILYINVTAAAFPLEMSPSFYRWSQAVPSYSAWQVLEDIWSQSRSKLYIYLPVLFIWWIVILALAALSLYKQRKTERSLKSNKFSASN